MSSSADKIPEKTTATAGGPDMSTSTNPDEMPKEALEAEPDAGEMNEAKEAAGMAALPTAT